MKFNQLTPAQEERLFVLSEELGEVQQAIGKVLRHGYASSRPDGGPNNKELLETELGDVAVAVRMLVAEGDVDQKLISEAAASNQERIKRFLHHQEDAIQSDG